MIEFEDVFFQMQKNLFSLCVFYFNTQQMGLLRGNQPEKRKVSTELAKLVEIFCSLCNSSYDMHFKKPYLIGTCQHIFCERCILRVFNGESKSNCPECQKIVLLTDHQPSKGMVNIIDALMGCQGFTIQRKLDHILASVLANDSYFKCFECKLYFDSGKRKPVMVCKQQHLLCFTCLQSKKQSQRHCLECKDKPQFFQEEELSFCQIVQLVCEFINKTLYQIDVAFIFQQKCFELNVANHVTLFDIFNFLQEYDNIPRNLQIKKCIFYFEINVGNQNRKEKVHLRSTVGEVLNEANKLRKYSQNHVNISIQFQEDAVDKERNTTATSNIMSQMSIQSEESVSRFKYSEQSEKEYSYSSSISSRIRSMSVKSQNNSAQIAKDSSLFFKREENVRNFRRESQSQRQIPQQRIVPNLGSSIRRKVPAKKYLKQGTQIEKEKILKAITNLDQDQIQQILQKFIANQEADPKNEQLLCFIIQKLMNEPISKEEMYEHQNLQEQIEKRCRQPLQTSNNNKKKNVLEAIIIKMLKSQLEDSEVKVTFSNKSTQKSKLTMKLLTSHFLSDRIMIEETINENDQQFQKIYQSQEELKNFIKFQKKRFSIKYGVDIESVVFHSVIKGSIKVKISTCEIQNFQKNIRKNLHRKIKLHPYLTHLVLSPQDFDGRGYIEFSKDKKYSEFRGNWPYYQPINSIRYGINVWGKFDSGNNNWLMMQNKPGEWVVGFHGVRKPSDPVKDTKNVIQSILGGLHDDKKQMLIKGAAQAYRYDKCVNKGGLVGEGVYLTPYFRETFRYTDAKSELIEGKRYRLIFQCRLDPKQIRIPQTNQEYWVVIKSAAIRPYGIVLIEDDLARTYPHPKSQFNEPIFTYAGYKNRIEGEE